MPQWPRAEPAAPGQGARLRLAVPCESASVETARLAVLAHLAPLKLPPRVQFRLELVLEETLMNRVLHAHPEGVTGLVEIEVLALPDAVQLRFTDDGLPFDPLEHAEQARPVSLAQTRPGGLGLLLTKKSVSAAHYQHLQGRNVLTLQVPRAG